MKYRTKLDSGLRDAAASENKSLPIHRWVPWIAGFSAQFVEDAIRKYLPADRRARHLILDPFAGVGTTLIEGIKAGHGVVGYEINPFAALVARAKIDCVEVSPSELRAEVDAFRIAMQRLESEVDKCYSADPNADLLTVEDLAKARPENFKSRIPFFSPPIEAKFLYALIRTSALLEPDRSLFRAALGATMVSYSNYTYEPSLASRPGSGKALIENAAVGPTICRKLEEMLTDIEWARQTYGYNWLAQSRDIRQTSYFEADLEEGSVSLVVTSPPYMNNYHYVRNTRPQLHWLGLITNGGGNRLERASFGKFWQTVRQGERVDLDVDLPGLAESVGQLRAKHPEKRQYGGAGWANYVATYLNDSFRFTKSLRRHLAVGGHAVIVIGNSIIQGIEFPVDRLLAQMSEQNGLHVEDIHIVRTKRVGNSIIDSSVRNGDVNGHRGKTQLYDAAVVLRR
ncbi:MAG: site-specific DNA-methyltransferase [Chloroflexi bacterium]|nr:MAG: site-specific DNA-methyltransferase [Chloroflexota bacterium]